MIDSVFWQTWIIALTVTCVGLVLWILLSTRKGEHQNTEQKTTGHSFDGIEEMDNPLPKWWFWLFIATIVFAAIYLILYPGFWQGALGWSGAKQFERQEQKYQKKYSAIFEKYYQMPLDEVIEHPKAVSMGQRIFINNCALCHGSNAQGVLGFPDLTDNDWLYGGDAKTIETTINQGRHGQMPAWKPIIGEQGVSNVAQYLLSLNNNSKANQAQLTGGKVIFDTTCSICHGKKGTGNHLLGAPNLTDDVWLYGSSLKQLKTTIGQGRSSVMPAWKNILGKEKIHLAAAYVYSLTHKSKLSNQDQTQ